VQDLHTLVCDEGGVPSVLAKFGFRDQASFDSGFGNAGREGAANYSSVAVRGAMRTATADTAMSRR
jgi:hypothetical protein